MEDYLTKHVMDIKENEQRSKSNQHRIDKLEEQQKVLYEMNANIKVIAEKTKDQESEIKEVRNDVKILKEKPNKNWNTLTAAVITALASGLVGAFLMLLLK